MLAEERRFRIRETLSSQRTVSASDLCEALALPRRQSGETWPRSSTMAYSFVLTGSGFPHVQYELPTFLRTLSHSHSAEKHAIARAAERLVLDGETVFLEGSTTVYELARALHQRNRLTVVTIPRRSSASYKRVPA